MRAGDLCKALDLPILPKNTEGIRSKPKRLVTGGIPTESEPACPLNLAPGYQSAPPAGTPRPTPTVKPTSGHVPHSHASAARRSVVRPLSGRLSDAVRQLGPSPAFSSLAHMRMRAAMSSLSRGSTKYFLTVPSKVRLIVSA